MNHGMTYNFRVKIIGLWLILLTFFLNAARLKQIVQFESYPVIDDYTPFSVSVPAHVRSQFVRFINPRNGQSAVARVRDQQGDGYVASDNVSNAIGLGVVKRAILYIEEIY